MREQFTHLKALEEMERECIEAPELPTTPHRDRLKFFKHVPASSLSAASWLRTCRSMV